MEGHGPSHPTSAPNAVRVRPDHRGDAAVSVAMDDLAGSMDPAIAELARRMGEVIPPRAVVRREGDVLAILWDYPAGGGTLGLRAVAARGTGAPAFVQIECTAHGPGTLPLDELFTGSEWPDPVHGVPNLAPLLALPTRGNPGHGGEELAMAIAVLATRAPARVLMAMLSFGVTDRRALRWLSDPIHGPALIAFCRAHPWLAGKALGRDDFLRLATDHPPDQAAARIAMTWLGIDAAAAGRLCAALAPTPCWEAAGNGEEDDGIVVAAEVRAVAGMPARLLPGAPGMAHGPAQARAILSMAEDLQAMAMASGRDVSGIVGRIDDWAAYAAKVARRAGWEDGPDGDSPHAAATSHAYFAHMAMRDMARAFAGQVMAPALVAMGWDPGHVAPEATHSIVREVSDPVFAASLRLLLGERTYPALAEVARDWHVRHQPAITAALTAMGNRDEAHGPAAFSGEVPLGDGSFAVCLNRVRDLVDEGSPDADATGAEGLAHCVATYADVVVAGTTVVVSVRRRLPDGGLVRLSTAEVDFVDPRGPAILQHLGRRNGPVDPASTERLRVALAPLADGACAAIAAWEAPPPSRRGPLALMANEAGAWERIRDLWAFALPRPLRGLSARDLVRASGHPVDP